MNNFFVSIFVIGFLALCYTFVEAKLMRVNRQTVVSPKLPVDFDGYTIAFVADLHNNSKHGHRIKKLVDKINKLNPDIVLIGGDLNYKFSSYHEVCFKELSKLKMPCYTVLGNHDYQPDEEISKQLISKYGIGDINNRSFWIKKGSSKIKIGGLDDYWFGYPYPESFLHDLKESDFSVLVCHNPDYFEVFNMKFVSLALAGHHHGGQCSFFGLWAPMVRSELGIKYTGRIKHPDGTDIICTNGIGTSHLPVRFCAIPEINLITLRAVGDKNG